MSVVSTLLDFFSAGIQLNLLLSYLDLYLLGDDTSISQRLFMQTNHLFVLIHMRNKGSG